MGTDLFIVPFQSYIDSDQEDAGLWCESLLLRRRPRKPMIAVYTAPATRPMTKK